MAIQVPEAAMERRSQVRKSGAPTGAESKQEPVLDEEPTTVKDMEWATEERPVSGRH